MQVRIEDDLYKAISEYCSINKLKISHYVNELLQKQFMLDKYGSRPSIFSPPKPKVETIIVETKIEEKEVKDEPKVVNEIKTEEVVITEPKEDIKKEPIITIIDDEDEDIIEQPKQKKRKLK